MSKEDTFTIGVADYLRLQYPYILFAHIPNGGSRNVIEGAKLKRMGTRAGMPDIMIFQTKVVEGERMNFCPGLAIELKVAKNKQTDSQKEVQQRLEKTGWKYFVCYEFEEAKKIIDEYLNVKILLEK